VAEREVSGDFDYLWNDPADVDGLTSHDQVFEAEPAEELDPPLNDPGDDLWDEPDDNFWDNQTDPDAPGHFDAFNINNWNFTPAPTPWYRTRQAVTAIIAASTAMAAIVVSAVLLVFRGQGDTVVDDVTSSVTPTAPTSAAPAQVASSEAPPPPLPPETAAPETAAPETAAPETAAPETAASPANTAPSYNPTYQPRPTKEPEIGVTRTPITRSPISVAPQPRGPNTGHR
jgi:hypothetical protein